MLHGVGKQIIGNGIQPKSAQRYAHRVIQHVNREQEEAYGQKNNKDRYTKSFGLEPQEGKEK